MLVHSFALLCCELQDFGRLLEMDNFPTVYQTTVFNFAASGNEKVQ